MKEEKSFEISQHQVLEAYKRIKANQGAAGIDGVNFSEYEKDLKNNLYKLWNRMSSGSYFPMAVKGVEIPKKNGKMRLLGIPTIADRVAQMVIHMNLEPLVEPVFCEGSYGYRPNRSAIDAIRATRERCWKMPWIIEFDIVGLFDNIDHELMMQAVRKHTNSKWIILYIERSLEADMVMADGTIKQRHSGTPQGGVTSAILANLFMHYTFDRWMVTQNPNNPWARYADDGVIHCHTKVEAEQILNRLKKRLSTCKLEIHPDKTRIVYCRSDNFRERHENESFDFLGYTFRRRTVMSKTGIHFNSFTPAVSKDATKEFRGKMRECRYRAKMLTPEEFANVMNPVIRGWANYFTQFCASEAKRNALDYVNSLIIQWARRRYKHLNGSYGKAFKWVVQLNQTKPNLFYHWQLGICLAMG